MAFLSVVCQICTISCFADKQINGFHVQFHGEERRLSTAAYDVELRFHGIQEDFEYEKSFAISPFSSERAADGLIWMLNRDKIETKKVNAACVVILGYRGPDNKLYPPKSVKFKCGDKTTLDQLPSIKDVNSKL